MKRHDPAPRTKLHNPERHLKSLQRWAETVDQLLDAELIEHSKRDYWNLKLPVSQRLVSPAHTTTAIQKACIEALFKAAVTIREKSGVRRKYRLAVLLATPDLFSSETTLFFSEEYLHSLFPDVEMANTAEGKSGPYKAYPAEHDLRADLEFAVPPAFEWLGGYKLDFTDPEDSTSNFSEHRWMAVEKLSNQETPYGNA